MKQFPSLELRQSLSLIAFVLALGLAPSLSAQDSSPTATPTAAPTSSPIGVTNTGTGVSGRDDKLSRSPVLTVRTIPGDPTKILIDAVQRNREYTLYPMTFDIYVNRRLFSTQYRSNSLPGAIGVDVGSDVATLPFNYTIVAKVITPNGNPFSTVFEGAVFASDLSGLLDCTISFLGTTSSDFVKNDVPVQQTGNDSFRLDIVNAEAIGSDDTLDGVLVASVEGANSASGSLRTVQNDSSSTARLDAVSGIINRNLNGVSAIRMVGESGVSINCS